MPAGKSERKTTEYVVLAAGKGDAPGEWEMVPDQPYLAISALEAVKLAARDHPGSDTLDRFVAVPARSWKPMQRTVEQVTKERWTA